jgi:hypothetical protein
MVDGKIKLRKMNAEEKLIRGSGILQGVMEDRILIYRERGNERTVGGLMGEMGVGLGSCWG